MDVYLLCSPPTPTREVAAAVAKQPVYSVLSWSADTEAALQLLLESSSWELPKGWTLTLLLTLPSALRGPSSQGCGFAFRD